jgi:hypothetical protein
MGPPVTRDLVLQVWRKGLYARLRTCLRKRIVVAKGLYARLKTCLRKRIVVAKLNEMETGSDLTEFAKACYGS